MLHAHHFINYVKKETSDYVMFTALILALQFSVLKFLSYETAVEFSTAILIAFAIILFFKALLRRIHYFLMVPSSEYKYTEWITLIFMFSLGSSFLIMLGYLTFDSVLSLNGDGEKQYRIVLYSGLLVSFIIPGLISELAFQQHSGLTMVRLQRLATVVMYSGSIIIPLMYFPDPVLIMQLLILSAGLRLLIILVTLIDLQLIDFFALTSARLKMSFVQFVRLGSYDILFWVFIPVFYCFALNSLTIEFQIIFQIGFSVFVLLPVVFTQITELWSLIFKNFVRLNISSQFIDFTRHLNLLHAVVIFGISPFFLLVSFQMTGWLMGELPQLIDSVYFLTAFFFTGVSGYFLSNPSKEIVVLFNQRRELTSVLISVCIGTVISSVIFFHLLGGWGIYFGLLVGCFIYWIGINVVIQPLLGCDFKYVFPYVVLSKILLSAVVSAVAGYSVTLIPNPVFQKPGWIFFSYFCLYTVLIAYFGILKNDTGAGFFNWTRRLGNLH